MQSKRLPSPNKCWLCMCLVWKCCACIIQSTATWRLGLQATNPSQTWHNFKNSTGRKQAVDWTVGLSMNMKRDPASKQTEQNSNGCINMRLRSGKKPRPSCFCRLYANLSSSADKSYWITKNNNYWAACFTSTPQTHVLWYSEDQVFPIIFMSFISHVYKLWSLYTPVNCKNKQIDKTTIILILIKTQ